MGPEVISDPPFQDYYVQERLKLTNMSFDAVQSHQNLYLKSSKEKINPKETECFFIFVYFHFFGKISTEHSRKIPLLSGQLVNKLKPAKSEVCCSGLAVSVVVTSFHIMLASVQLSPCRAVTVLQTGWILSDDRVRTNFTAAKPDFLMTGGKTTNMYKARCLAQVG